MMLHIHITCPIVLSLLACFETPLALMIPRNRQGGHFKPHRTHDDVLLVRHSAVVDTGSIEDNLRFVREKHDAEVATGFAMFGSVDGDRGRQRVKRTVSSRLPLWADTDFISRSVGAGEGVADPLNHKLQRSNKICITTNPIFSEEECDALISEAKEVIAAGLLSEQEAGRSTNDKERGRERTNSELNEARVSTMPRGREWLQTALRERLFPLLESRFGNCARDLTLNDALIIGYIAPSSSQPIHRDASLLSLNIALSPLDDYSGGGTYFEGLEDGNPVKIDRGHVICHSSAIMHAGHGIATGERWILVLFCIDRNEPQISRRCHAAGVNATDRGDLDEAQAFFEAGLSVAPNDHLLRLSLARVHSARGEHNKARSNVLTATQSYRHCQKPLITLANMLLSERRPRAALRRLDLALARINNRDLLDGAWMPLRATGWEARVLAARCAILCSEWESMKYADKERRHWTRAKLPEAIERLRLALNAAPDDERLLSLFERAEHFLKESRSGSSLP